MPQEQVEPDTRPVPDTGNPRLWQRELHRSGVMTADVIVAPFKVVAPLLSLAATQPTYPAGDPAGGREPTPVVSYMLK